MSKEYCNDCGHLTSKHYKDVNDVIRCMVVERGTSTRGVIGLPYEKDCNCTNGKLSKTKANRTGTVYDDEIAIAHKDAERMRKHIQRARKRGNK